MGAPPRPQVEALEAAVSSMRAKGAQGFVAREEMMRALGAITTDLAGRIKVWALRAGGGCCE